MVKLRSGIVAQKGSSYTWTAMHRCLLHWAETRESPKMERILRGSPERVKQPLREAMLDQEAIGWNFAFRGYLSIQWARAQKVEHPKSTNEEYVNSG